MKIVCFTKLGCLASFKSLHLLSLHLVPPPPYDGQGYPPQQGYPAQQGYPPKNAYPPQQGYAPQPAYQQQYPPATGYAPAPPQQQSSTNVVVVQGGAPAVRQTTVIQPRRPQVNHILHLLITIFIFPPWVFVWIILCAIYGCD